MNRTPQIPDYMLAWFERVSKADLAEAALALASLFHEGSDDHELVARRVGQAIRTLAQLDGRKVHRSVPTIEATTDVAAVRAVQQAQEEHGRMELTSGESIALMALYKAPERPGGWRSLATSMRPANGVLIFDAERKSLARHGLILYEPTLNKARLTDKGIKWVEARHAESAEARPV